jgi:hypothetical protein
MSRKSNIKSAIHSVALSTESCTPDKPLSLRLSGHPAHHITGMIQEEAEQQNYSEKTIASGFIGKQACFHRPF